VLLRTALLFVLAFSSAASSGKSENVLVVVNANSAMSRSIGEYYARRRSIPSGNVCTIKAPVEETVSRDEYNRLISAGVGSCLKAKRLVEQVLYIVTTQGVPLRVKGATGMNGDNASVDSELALLYGDLRGAPRGLRGPAPNPFFRQRDAEFRHPQFPIYLVTRLAAYDLPGVRAIIDRSLAARNRGKFVVDLRSKRDESGDEWLRNAAILLPADRLVLEETDKVVYGEKQVIAYASWGSNDPNRKQRHLGFEWLPGAIATEYVSTNGRTFAKPPDGWNIGTWKDRISYFAASPQSLTADFIADGATGASGHVNEPYLGYTPRPDYVLPAYHSGRNLAESFYLALPALSWQNIIIGDPLCSIGESQ
jgi:uncharacterized protein (TIGR03790 family)